MTSEEAIHALDTLVEAYGVAIRAIRAQIDVKGVEIDTVKSAKVDRRLWEGCKYCNDFGKRRPNFCYYCGKPQTEEAWTELDRRIERCLT